MYELYKVGAGTYYIQAPAKMGLYVNAKREATLIDSGNDKEAGRKINQHLRENNWALKTILNTHSNADHIGGNAFLQQRTDCAILSTPIENIFAQYPHLEPSFLYGGFPPKPLNNKFLKAQPSKPTGTVDSLDEGFESIPLPGHYFDMVGYRTPDGIVFLADCLSGAHIIEKYHINFIYNVEAYLKTLEMVEGISARLFIPAHAEPVEDIRPLAALNRSKVEEVIRLLSKLINSPLTTEDVLKAVFDHYSLKMDFSQYVLVGSTLKSYLAYLLNQGRAEAVFEGNKLFWRAV